MTPALPQEELPAIWVEVDLDLTDGVAVSRFPNAEHPYGVFDEMDFYARRYNAGEREARPWVHVRGDRLQKDTGGLATREAVHFYAGFALNPIVLLDLATAPLTGSIEVLGTEPIAGVETTHYEANFDTEKMLEDTRKGAYPEDRREMVDTLLNLLVITGNTHAGEVWVDADGLLRRFRVTLRQNPFADVKFDLVLTLDLTDIGGPVDASIPGTHELVSVGSIRSFLNAAVPAPDSEDFVRTVIGVARD